MSPVDIIRYLTVEIGPRTSASHEEQAATAYIANYLQDLGIVPARESFKTIERFSKRLMPQFIAGAIVTLTGNRFLQLLGGLGLVAHHRQLMLGQSALWESALAWHTSENIIARIPAKNLATRQLILTTPLDSSTHRPSLHPNLSGWIPLMLAAAQVLPILAGLLPRQDADSEDHDWLHYVIGGLLAGLGVATMLDELGDPVQGANGNAAGIAILLNLAETLAQQPLENTEIWLVFTGSQTAGNTGMAAFLQQHRQVIQDAAIITLDHVGCGHLCWITEHRLDALVNIAPDDETHELMTYVAHQHPELGVMGRSMAGLQETINVRRAGLRGVCLSGYDRITGEPPHRYRHTDTPEHIEPATLSTTLAFLNAIFRTIDQP